MATTSPFQRVLDTVETLPLEDQELLIDLLRHRLVERRRSEIARNAATTLQEIREGTVRYGSIDDLKKDLLSEP